MSRLTAFFSRLLFPALLLFSALPVRSQPKQVEVVFCLDLSASTNGLIERMRDHLWDYANLALECQPAPVLRIGVVGFSRPSFLHETGYVKVLRDLSTDIESLGKQLFDMKTSIEKGDQYVGSALIACARSISWTKDSSAIKVVILAGNGQVQAGAVDPRDAVSELKKMGISVNPFYCMQRVYNRREVSGWEELAKLGDGTFQTFSVATRYYTALGSFDLQRLHALNDSLNDTYIYYGAAGKSRMQMLKELDAKIYYANPEGYLLRSRFKCSVLFQGKNAAWDLVDYHQVRSTEPSPLDAATLPESLRDKSAEERKQIVAAARLARQRFVNEINLLLMSYREEEEAKDGPKEKTMPSFDVLAMNVIIEQMEKNGYVCRPGK